MLPSLVGGGLVKKLYLGLMIMVAAACGGNGHSTTHGTGAGGGSSSGPGAGSTGSSGAGGTACTAVSGFSPTPADFSLPVGYSTNAFSGFASTGGPFCNGQDIPAFALLDADGDRRSDLVVTRRCNDVDTGNTKWLVYQNTGTGFTAAPADFSLPVGYSTNAFSGFTSSGGPYCNGQDIPAYALLDTDGDGRSDLVVTRRCNDMDTGNTKWLVYKDECSAP